MYPEAPGKGVADPQVWEFRKKLVKQINDTNKFFIMIFL
jgi:hypothetical protein